MTELEELTNGKNFVELLAELSFQIKSGEGINHSVCSHILDEMKKVKPSIHKSGGSFSEPKEINEDDFDAVYKPIKNSLTDNDVGDQFETYGVDLEFVKSLPKENVWTVVSTDSASEISPGFHHVNRLYYLVTEVPHNEDVLVIDEDELTKVEDDKHHWMVAIVGKMIDENGLVDFGRHFNHDQSVVLSSVVTDAIIRCSPKGGLTNDPMALSQLREGIVASIMAADRNHDLDVLALINDVADVDRQADKDREFEFTHFEHSEHTDSIRMYPQNYVVAVRSGAQFKPGEGMWLTDCDSAISSRVAKECFLEIRGNAHISGDALVQKLNNKFLKKKPVKTTVTTEEKSVSKRR